MRKIIAFISLLVSCIHLQAQEKPLPANEILSVAYKQAEAQNKTVLVIFHASWCGWCKKMDASINDPACKKMFDDNYIIVHLTVHENGDKKKDENPGADELLKKYNAFDEGIPVWLFYDKNGNLVGDSFIKSAEGKQTNIGCPASEDEVAAFVKILKSTSSLNNEALNTITTVFRKNENRQH